MIDWTPLADLIEKHDRFMLTTHIRPDGDALGSEVGMAGLLRQKGKDVREHFRSAPFGWPQDAVDGALFVLLVAGNLRATINGQPAQAQKLPQSQVGVASFSVDVPPLNVQQRLDLLGEPCDRRRAKPRGALSHLLALLDGLELFARRLRHLRRLKDACDPGNRRRFRRCEGRDLRRVRDLFEGGLSGQRHAGRPIR